MSNTFNKVIAVAGTAFVGSVAYVVADPWAYGLLAFQLFITAVVFLAPKPTLAASKTLPNGKRYFTNSDGYVSVNLRGDFMSEENYIKKCGNEAVYQPVEIK